jgi:hypothetical protein
VSEQTPITWAGIVSAIEYPRGELTAGLRRSSNLLLRPDDHATEMTAERTYMEAYGRLYLRAEAAVGQLNDLRERLYADRPGRPLEAVLAEIEALGHAAWSFTTYGAHPIYYCASHRPGVDYRASDEHAGWKIELEHGEAQGATPVEAAEKRLSEIRELHEQKRAALLEQTAALLPDPPLTGHSGTLDIEDGQEGRYVVGYLEADILPWWVVDTRQAVGPVQLHSFPTKEGAVDLKLALNAGDIEDADRIIAAEVARREAAESESGEGEG